MERFKKDNPQRPELYEQQHATLWLNAGVLEQSEEGRAALSRLEERLGGALVKNEHGYVEINSKDYMDNILDTPLHKNGELISTTGDGGAGTRADVAELRGMLDMHNEVQAEYRGQMVDYVDAKEGFPRDYARQIIEGYTKNPARGWQEIYRVTQNMTDDGSKAERMKALEGIKDKIEDFRNLEGDMIHA